MLCKRNFVVFCLLDTAWEILKCDMTCKSDGADRLRFDYGRAKSQFYGVGVDAVALYITAVVVLTTSKTISS
jgi:hypothetical protein